MKDSGKLAGRGRVLFWCERCQIKVWGHIFGIKRYCPVCQGEMVVHVERKEVNDAQEKKPGDSP